MTKPSVICSQNGETSIRTRPLFKTPMMTGLAVEDHDGFAQVRDAETRELRETMTRGDVADAVVAEAVGRCPGHGVFIRDAGDAERDTDTGLHERGSAGFTETAKDQVFLDRHHGPAFATGFQHLPHCTLSIIPLPSASPPAKHPPCKPSSTT